MNIVQCITAQLNAPCAKRVRERSLEVAMLVRRALERGRLRKANEVETAVRHLDPSGSRSP